MTSVLLIGGAGRSGSTLLERLLSSSRSVTGVGELRWLWKRGFAESHLCSCGEPFPLCPFWRSVTASALPGEVDAEEMQEAARRVDRIRYIPFHAWPRLAPEEFRRSLKLYGDVLDRVFDAIAAESRSQLIVDSSKEPAYAFLLRRVPSLQVYVVHLVRDSRAVAFSWQRLRPRPEITERVAYMPQYGIAKSSRDWLEKNTLFEGYRATGGNLIRVRYEDLAADPASTVNGVLREVGERLGLDLGVCGDDQDLPHSISGNPIRFSASVPTVRKDDEWRTAMDARDRACVSLMTSPMLLRYGYSLSSR
jgi:sulfotransferase family protein